METINTRLAVDNKSSIHLCIKKPTFNTCGCIIFSHGFSVAGFESYRFFWELSNELTANDFICVLFDYRGSGYSDLSFSDMTIDTEIEDLNCVIDYVVKDIYSETNLIIWGCSFGSGVASLVGAQRNDIGGFLLWCLSAELEQRYSKTLGTEIHKVGYVYIDKGDKVKKDFLDSLKNKDVYNSISQIPSPILFVHGTDDTKASVNLSKQAFEMARGNKELALIEGGNHGFKCQPEQFAKAKKISFEWIDRITKRTEKNGFYE
ncbi:MAG: lysophospholipase [Chitinispirillales bacterium]|jgi:pimeloyl-ACP methyl ester carboxylesterase|nr:lysophospholipase [Chitinispirillales bacterium]